MRRLTVIAGTLALVLVLPACLLSAPPAGRGPAPALAVTQVVGGLDHVWDLAFAPAPESNRMIYDERSGRVWAKQLPSGAPVLLGQLGAGLPANATFVAAGEGGLLGLAIDPAFATNRSVYLCYTTTTDVRLARFTVPTFTAGALTHAGDVVTGMPVNPSGRHSGCRPRFRPGTNPPQLFVGTGDAAMDGGVPQRLTSLGGKILCVTTNGQGCPGNPGIGVGNFDDRIYNWGHRNVQGIAFSPSGNVGWSVEHGPDRDDELNLMLTENYGWNPVGSIAYDESRPMTRNVPGDRWPVWGSGVPTIAPSGLTMLTGRQWKGWDGALAVAVLKDRQLRIFFLTGIFGQSQEGWQIALTDRGRLRSAVQGPDGNLYISTDNGSMSDQILKVVPG